MKIKSYILFYFEITILSYCILVIGASGWHESTPCTGTFGTSKSIGLG